MAKQLIARGQATVYAQKDAYNINQSVSEYVFAAGSSGTIVNTISFTSTVKVMLGDKSIADFTIGTITKPTGFSSITVNNTNKTITYSISANTSTLANSGTVPIPVVIGGETHYISFSWSKAFSGQNGVNGQDAYTVSLSRNSYVISTDKDGKIHTAVTATTIVSALKGSNAVTPVIGALPQISGCVLSKSGTTVTIVFSIGTSLAENGVIDIPLTVDGKSLMKSFSFAKARTGANGTTGAAGVDANMLDWVKDWNTNKTVIGSDSIITPKIFAGAKNSNGTLTGIAIGKYTLSTLNTSGAITTETINGIYGFKDGYKTFFVDNGGNAQFGKGNQFIKYNASTGKIEFGSEVSLNWINAINTAKSDAISITDNKISSIQIGLRNYILNSSFKNATLNEIIKLEGVTGIIDTSQKIQGCNSIKITQTNAPTANATSNRAYFNAIKICSPASFCMWIKASVATTLMIRIGANGAKGIPIDTNWKLIKLENWQPTSSVVLFAITSVSATYNIAQPMLVEGTKAVDWAPASEDIEVRIEEAKTAGINAQNIADAITKKANDEKWGTKLTYIDANGIYTGTLSANTVNALKINASQITAGTIDAARINVSALKSSLITAANIEALTLNVIRGKIGGWSIDSDSIFKGTKNNTSGGYTSASGSITVGSTGIRGFKWKFDSNGAGAVAGGNISWDASGNVTFGSSVSLNWTNAASNALTSAKTYADTKKTEAINAAATDATSKVNNIRIGGRNLIPNTNKGTSGWMYTVASGTNAYSETSALNTRAVKSTCSALSTGYHVIARSINRLLLKNSTQYTISFDIYCDFDTTLALSIRNSNGQNTLISWSNTTIKKQTWIKVLQTATSNTDTTTSQVLYITGFNTVGSAIFANLKLEEGSKATQWTPAPEDIDNSISNAQSVADAITKKANDGKWGTKLTYIDANGIFTGTLSANTVNAIRIDASQITAGTIDAARINVNALKTSLITAANIDALTLNVTKGKIGGWNIGADNITIGSLDVVGQTPIQIRSASSGSGTVYNGAYKPYGITLSWYQNQNAGHIGLGQILATGSTVRSGFAGIQMIAWDNTEYFCLSANTAKSGAKEVYNRIAGWAFDNTRIWKNNVSLGADGSITNGNLWQINNNGSGRLANGNITWDASGNVTFASTVSLNWTNAANNALTSAKTYADTQKTEAINTAGTDATTKMNNAKADGILYCKGTGMNRNANRLLTLNGNTVYNAGGRGLQLTVVRRSDLAVQSNVCYDIYGVADQRLKLANALNALNDSVIVVIASYDAIIIDATLATALGRCGGSGIQLNGRYPYVLVGIPDIGKGNGIEVYRGVEATVPHAEVTTRIVSGIPQGINSVQALALQNAANAQSLADKNLAAMGGTAYPKLTKIDSTGIYTGTLTASQISAGTISADRIASGSLNASKLDAASIKSSIINTDYINGLTCTFVRGKIGGWNIGSDTITIGSIGGTGAIPIQIRSASTGSGYVYNGSFKPLGITMSWHQSSNAGHFVFGQIMSNGNTAKAGFIGIQMMAWDNTEYFCLATNYTKSGSKEIYNRIAGWAFDNDTIYMGAKNNSSGAYTSASGAISIGSNGIRGFKWRLDSNGAGAVAGGNISWDASGNVTFGSSVSLNWTNAANNALTSAKSYADTKKNEAVSAAATDATNKVNAINIGGRNYARNTSNAWGTVTTFNNTNNQCLFGHTVSTDSWIKGDTICVSFDYKYDNIVKAGTATTITFQGGGNVTNYTNGFTGHNFFSKIDFTKKSGILRVVYTFIVTEAQLANASFNVNIRHDYLTGAATIRNLKVEIGTKPTDWSPAPEDISQRLTQITSAGVYTGSVVASQIKVDSALIVGGSTYNGSVSVRDASNAVKVTLDRNGITAVGGTIGGWVIASNQISKNSVIFGSDGTISNGSKWKLGNDGAGYVANGNVSWNTAGAVTITGTVNASSGMIGGFTISGNKLTNKASDSAIIFNSLSGSSFLRINEDSYNLLGIRADSARTAISIQTYAAGAKGISIIANAGSTYAIESYGPHQFGQRSGEKWNAPGVLFSALVKNSNTLYNRWGNGMTVSNFYKTQTGNFTCVHNLGHTEYIVVANPYWDSGTNWHGNCFIRVEYIGTTSFNLRVVNADNGKLVDTCFTFAVIGRNRW